MRSRAERNNFYRSFANETSRSSGTFRRYLPRRPKDVLSLCLALAATGVIVVNALFLQTGPHPAPIFADVAVRAPVAATGAVSARTTGSRRSSMTTLGSAGDPTAVAPRLSDARHDPIAELLEPSNRMTAVQKALTDFGYGQIKPTGMLGPETKAAIERFERERNLPITGQISERLTRELAAMKGSPL